MIRALSVLLLCALSASAAPVPKETKASDKLDGVWEMTSMEVRGTPAAVADVRWSIDGDKVTVRSPAFGSSPLGPVGIRVDADALPKAIDYNLSGRGGARPGIYEIAGDTLRVLVSVRGGDRPKAMKSDESTVFYTFKRVKE